jgi:tetratricopeptide (TPR) repeat protein
MKYNVIAFLFLLLISCSKEQEIRNEVDLKDVDVRLNHYWDMYEENKANMPDSALFYMQEIKKLAEAGGKYQWLAAAYVAIGDIYRKEGEVGESAYHYLRAIKSYKELGELKRLAVAYTSLGLIYEYVEDYEKAVFYSIQAKEIYNYEGNSFDKANVCRNLAIYYSNLGLFEEAEEYARLAEKNALEAKDYDMLSKIYNTYGVVKFKQENFESAREFYEKALYLSDSAAEGQWVKAAATNNIFEVYFFEKNYEKAMRWYRKVMALKEELKDPVSTQISINLYGEMLIEQGKNKEAVKVLLDNFSLPYQGKTNAAIGEGLVLVQEALAKIAAEGKAEDAPYLSKHFELLNAYSKKHESQVSQLREELQILTKQLSVKANVEKYAQQEEAEKAAELNLKIILISVFLLICATATIVWMMRKNKHYKELFSKVEGILHGQAVRHMKKS